MVACLRYCWMHNKMVQDIMHNRKKRESLSHFVHFIHFCGFSHVLHLIGDRVHEAVVNRKTVDVNVSLYTFFTFYSTLQFFNRHFSSLEY